MRKSTKKEFVEKAKTIHCKFDYSKVDYTNSKTKVEIGCPIHGYFWQKPNDHLSGRGCEKCGIGDSASTRRAKKENIIDRFNKVHNFKYDYSKIDYVNNSTDICIICPKHGAFFQQPKHHSKGFGCSKCSNKSKPDDIDLINRFNKIHSKKFEYDEMLYDSAHTKIKIRCKNHGYFLQTPHEHLKGQGCPSCSKKGISNLEKEVVCLLKELTNVRLLENDKIAIHPLELDIYLPSLNKAIEFNGTYWHYNQSNKNCKPRGYHAMKSNLCRDKNIKLLHIREDLWKKDQEKMKNVIIKFLKYEI